MHTMMLPVLPVEGSDELMIELPPEVLSHLKVQPGDLLLWTENPDGSIYLSRAPAITGQDPTSPSST